MFTQQLISETVPTLALNHGLPSLNDCGLIRRLLEQHTGYAQFRIVLPGVVTWSAEAARIRGQATEMTEISLEDAVLAYVPGDRERVVDIISEAIAEQRGFHFTARRRVGDEVKIIETIGDVKVEDGVVTEIYGVTRDVTVNVEREAMGISRARLIRRMVEGMPVPVVVLDRGLRVVACSAAWAKSYGLSGRAEALGRPINKLAMLSRDMMAAIVEAMSGRTAQIAVPFYDAREGMQVKRNCVVMPWQSGADATGGVLMLVGEEQPPYATLEIADRALGRRHALAGRDAGSAVAAVRRRCIP